MRKIIYAIATLSGSIIGAGIFSLPYITSKVGILVILAYFFILGIIVIFLSLLFGEVALKTPDFNRLPGYAKIYLGNWGKNIAFFSSIFGFFGTILAYLIIGGKFLTNLLLPIFGGNENFYTILYFALGAVFILRGIRTIAKVELFSLILFFLILAVIFFQGFHLLKIENYFPSINWQMSLFFLPFGPILFSLWGADLIPEIEEMLGKDKKILKKIIPLAILIPIFTYLVFILLVTGISGNQTDPQAIPGLKNFLGQNIINLVFFFGTLTTFTSFLTLGLTLRNIFWYDLKFSKNLSWFITCFFPLFLFFAGLKNFISIISLVGGVMLATNGILIILMYQAVKKIPRQSFRFFLTSFLIFIFILEILYETLYFLKDQLF